MNVIDLPSRKRDSREGIARKFFETYDAEGEMQRIRGMVSIPEYLTDDELLFAWVVISIGERLRDEAPTDLSRDAWRAVVDRIAAALSEDNWREEDEGRSP